MEQDILTFKGRCCSVFSFLYNNCILCTIHRFLFVFRHWLPVCFYLWSWTSFCYLSPFFVVGDFVSNSCLKFLPYIQRFGNKVCLNQCESYYTFKEFIVYKARTCTYDPYRLLAFLNKLILIGSQLNTKVKSLNVCSVLQT